MVNGNQQYDFYEENGKPVNLSLLKAKGMLLEDYKKAHEGIVISCHDVVIDYKGGALLVIRNNFPAKEILWPLGGRMLRGIPTEESLKLVIKGESGLDLKKITRLGSSRNFWQTDPFGHGHGTDTTSEMFYARGVGELRLNEDHQDSVIVKPKDYTEEFRSKLHPLARLMMDLAMPLIKANNKH